MNNQSLAMTLLKVGLALTALVWIGIPLLLLFGAIIAALFS